VLCRPKKEGKLPTIVLSVGINAKAREMLPLVEGLAKQGYNVFAPDSRTSMSSEPGEDLARGDIADLLNAVKFLHEQSWFDGSYVLLGVSIGGARSLIAAGRMAKTPEFTGVDAKYKYPKAVVSLGGYASMEDEFNYLRWLVELKGEKPELKVKLPEFAEKWVAWVSEKAARDGLTAEQVSREFWERSPLKFVGDIPASCPLFIGHGFDDRVIPSGDARRLAEMRPENTVLRRDVGGGIHTVIDVLTDVNPYRLRPVKFGRKFVSDLVTGHKTPAEATWYLIDDLKDVVGLGLTAYELDRFLRKSLPKSSE
jgi:pimeloyl-ACP methyl ester carboxylesterase